MNPTKQKNKKAIIIGAGPMGLMPAYELQKKGYDLTSYEHDDRIGGMSCVLFKLKKPLSKHFSVNVNNQRIELPGVIEYSNLNPDLTKGSESILYAPYYLPYNHEKYRWSHAKLTREAKQYLRYISKDWNEQDVIATQVARYAYSQKVCGTNFLSQLPPKRSPKITGFYMADTFYYYPEDRSISETFRIGSTLAG